LAVRLRVDEVERIGGLQIRVEFLPRAVEQHAQSVGRAHPEMVRALRADAERRRQVFVVDDFGAGRTLDPQPLGHPAFLLRLRLDGLPDLLEPRHELRLHQLPIPIYTTPQSALVGAPSCCERHLARLARNRELWSGELTGAAIPCGGRSTGYHGPCRSIVSPSRPAPHHPT